MEEPTLGQSPSVYKATISDLQGGQVTSLTLSSLLVMIITTEFWHVFISSLLIFWQTYSASTRLLSRRSFSSFTDSSLVAISMDLCSAS